MAARSNTLGEESQDMAMGLVYKNILIDMALKIIDNQIVSTNSRHAELVNARDRYFDRTGIADVSLESEIFQLEENLKKLQVKLANVREHKAEVEKDIVSVANPEE